MKNIKIYLQCIDEKKERLCGLSDSIWDLAETKFEEYKSAEMYSHILEKEGFQVERGIGGLETSFKGTYGHGTPVIGFLAEFDALPGLSQKAGLAKKEAVTQGGCGHGCGHNALGAGALAATLAVKEYLQTEHQKGTVILYGCPAEEGGSGKTWMVREGCFRELDVALTWHPDYINIVRPCNALASIQARFYFKGLSSHASKGPHLGRSALDAAELMNMGVQFLREHIISDARVHYAFLDSGGTSANIVPSNASLVYQIRAPKMSQAQEIYERVIKIAKGAALMTETDLTLEFDRACSDIRKNTVLNQVLQNCFDELGPTPVLAEDLIFAREIRETFSEEIKNSALEYLDNNFEEEMAEALKAQVYRKDIIDIVYPWKTKSGVYAASTDVGDVSKVVPTAQISTACYASGTPGHSWALTAQGKTPLLHRAMIQAGKIMGAAGIRLIQNPELILAAKAEFDERESHDPYIIPIPEGAKPKIPKGNH